MKKIICESCGSNDLIRDGAYIICDYCKSIYLAEEATIKKTTTTQIPTENLVIPEPINKLAADTKLAKDKKRPVSIFKRILGKFFIALGLIPGLCVFVLLSEGNWVEASFYGWWALLMLNGGYTSSTGTKIGLTAKFNNGQLTFFTLISLFLFFCYVNGFFIFKWFGLSPYN